MNTVFLSLGSNVGNMPENIHKAISYLQQEESVMVTRESSLYFTEPQGTKDVPWYTNAVVMVQTICSPEEILQKIQKIEKILGRERKEQSSITNNTIEHAPRTIDIDILLYNEVSLRTEELSIPHPRMCERAFVLIPLLEIAPNTILNGNTIEYYLRRISYTHEEDKIWQ